MSKKYYVVWKGRKPGIYTSWEECKSQVEGFQNAKYKSFKYLENAKEAFEGDPNTHFGNSAKTFNPNHYEDSENGPNLESISVDAACSHNPGIMEYRGVDTLSGAELFRSKLYKYGSNNLGEFLAIIHALNILKKKNSKIPIYTDSETALSWIRKGKINSSLPVNSDTEELWDLANRSLVWLRENEYENQLLKWNTKSWGEIPADFGRK